MILDKVISAINEVLGTELGDEDVMVSLKEYGMDSIAFIRIIVALEECFGCEVPDDKLSMSEMNTIKSMCDVITDLV